MNQAHRTHYICDICKRHVDARGDMVRYEQFKLCQHCHDLNEYKKKAGREAYKRILDDLDCDQCQCFECQVDRWMESSMKYINKQCECGADKCKTTHSTWCPKWGRNERNG